MSAPASALIGERVVGRLRVRHVHGGGEARHARGACGAVDDDPVRCVRAVDDHVVGLAVACAEVGVHLGDAGSGQVVLDDGVGAAERVEVDLLHAVRVHHDVAHVAGEPEAAAVRREVELLGGGGAVEHHRVGAVLALHDVAAVARIPGEGVVAGSQQCHVGAAVPVDRVVPVTGVEDVVAAAAGDRVVPGAAVRGELDRARGEARGVDRVVAVGRVDRERVVGGLGVRDVHRRCEAGHAGRTVAAGDRDRVLAVGAVDDHLVRLAVGGSEVDVQLVDLRCGQVVRGDRVGAAERVDVDLLHTVGVHRDVGDVAEEPEPPSVRRQGYLLGDVGAVEDHRVGAALAFHGVAAVARIPREAVVAGPQERGVAASVSVDRVLTRASDQRLGSGASGERVVPDSAVDRRRNGVGEDAVALVDAHGVVAAAGVDVDLRDVRPVEAEDGRAVTDVDLESAGLAGLQAKRDRVALLGAFDLQHAVAQLRGLEPRCGIRLARHCRRPRRRPRPVPKPPAAPVAPSAAP